MTGARKGKQKWQFEKKKKKKEISERINGARSNQSG